MIASISMWSLEARIKESGWNQKDFINWAAENKFEYVELVSYYMNNENNIDEVVQLLSDSGIKVSCYTILNDFSDLNNDGMVEFNKDLTAAAKLESPFVRVLTGDQDCSSAESRTLLINRLKTAAAAAADKGITLVMENIGPGSGHSAEIVSIMEDVGSENLRINFDTANPLLADEEPVDALKKMLPYVAYVHLKDFITDSSEQYSDYSQTEWRIQTSRAGKKMTGITAGMGEIPLVSIFDLLKNNGYKGFVSGEYENDLTPETASLDSLAYFKNQLL